MAYRPTGASSGSALQRASGERLPRAAAWRYRPGARPNGTPTKRIHPSTAVQSRSVCRPSACCSGAPDEPAQAENIRLLRCRSPRETEAPQRAPASVPPHGIRRPTSQSSGPATPCPNRSAHCRRWRRGDTARNPPAASRCLRTRHELAEETSRSVRAERHAPLPHASLRQRQ